jgi:hypothetical protein
MGLREKIKHADDESSLLSLIKTGDSYKYASERTKRSWKSTARYRLSEINNPIPAQTPQKSTEVKKQKSVKRKKK